MTEAKLSSDHNAASPDRSWILGCTDFHAPSLCLCLASDVACDCPCSSPGVPSTHGLHAHDAHCTLNDKEVKHKPGKLDNMQDCNN